MGAKMKTTPKTYERHDGALMAVCPETLADLNVHVWCWQCQSAECSFAGKTVEEIEREVKKMSATKKTMDEERAERLLRVVCNEKEGAVSSWHC
jgi:hypothetical protein